MPTGANVTDGDSGYRMDGNQLARVYPAYQPLRSLDAPLDFLPDTPMGEHTWRSYQCGPKNRARGDRDAL